MTPEEIEAMTDAELEAQVVPLMRQSHITRRAHELAEEACRLTGEAAAEVGTAYTATMRELHKRYRNVALAATLTFVDPPLSADVVTLEGD